MAGETPASCSEVAVDVNLRRAVVRNIGVVGIRRAVQLPFRSMRPPTLRANISITEEAGPSDYRQLLFVHVGEHGWRAANESAGASAAKINGPRTSWFPNGNFAELCKADHPFPASAYSACFLNLVRQPSSQARLFKFTLLYGTSSLQASLFSPQSTVSIKIGYSGNCRQGPLHLIWQDSPDKLHVCLNSPDTAWPST